MTRTSEPVPAAAAPLPVNQPQQRDLPASSQRRRWGRWLQLVWPIAALAILLIFNALATPGFFHLEMRNGRLVGV